jgi:hypothetical protein
MIEIDDAEELEFESEVLQSCSNDASGSIILSDFNYSVDLSWSNGSADSILSNLEAGENLEVSIAYGACIEVESFEIPAYPMTEFQVSSQHPLCFGSTDGSIAINETSDNQIISISWNNGEYSGAELNDLPGGIYSAELIDEYGCSYNESIELISPPELIVSTAIAPDENEGSSCPNTWLGTAFAQGGVSPYNYEWTIQTPGEPDLVIESTDFDCFNEGLISILVTDANGCTYSEVFELELLVSVNDIKNEGLIIYPNPSSDYLNFSSPVNPDWSYSIYNSLGQQIQSGTNLNNKPISISTLPEANYYLILFDESLNIVKRLSFIKVQ